MNLETAKRELDPNVEVELRPELQKLVEVITRENPELANVQVRTFKPKNAFDAGGYYVLEEHGDKIMPVIYISEGSPELLAPLIKIRKESIRINAELLGIEAQDMTPELLQLFIVTHEFGHIKDFIINYQNDPDLDGTETADVMWLHRDSILSMLPVPNLSPTELASELQNETNLQSVINFYLAIKQHPKFSEIKTVEDLLHLQEIAYRESEPERYADDFAAKILKKHAKELGISLQTKKIAA